MKHFVYETKYLKWYLDIIENVQNECRVKNGHEDHHILPSSLYEEFNNRNLNPWNSVLLTPREHFIVHVCIWKHYKSIGDKNSEKKMGHAIRMMSGQFEYNSTHYHLFKINHSPSQETKRKISETLMGYKHTDEAVQKIKMKRATQIMTKETGKKISEANMGHEVTAETRKKISEARKGMKFTDEHKRRLSEAKKNAVHLVGLNNNRANKIEIYNSDDELVGVSEGNFTQTCKDLGIPESAFKKSYQEDLKVYEGLERKSMITQLKNSGNWKYKDWYAINTSKEK